jgi:hypothetical protein
LSSRTIAAHTSLLALALGACAAVTALAATTSAASHRSRPPQRSHTVASTPTASLTAAFEPERLGRRTTLSFGFRIAGAGGLLPPPLTAIDLSYPANLGIALSGLGLATCTAGKLEASGLAGCRADSIMGFGEATAEISLGSSVVGESVSIAILRAPDEAGHISLLFYAVGASPLSTSAVFTAALLPAPAPFGGQVSIDVPLIASLPGAPGVSIVQMHATLGPHGVTYYERAEGRTLAYQPPGILLPHDCPRGGFPFAAQFSFVDGGHAGARATEPCPGPRRLASAQR